MRDIIATGYRGQTVWHEPMSTAPHTLQIDDNDQIVVRTGITVVGDFRRCDIALGGQDVSLVPAFHRVLLAHPTERRMVLNIGGIVSLSLPTPGQPAGGYDTDPGNMLMDARVWYQAGKPYDKDAEWAWAGKIILPLLQNIPCDPYFSQPVPKNTGREYFNRGWLERHLRHFPGTGPRDAQATLAELATVTISKQVLLSDGYKRLMAYGGGNRNSLLMVRLVTLLSGAEATTTDAVDISGDDMEALAFVWLAWRALAGLSENLPPITGVSQGTIPGAVLPADPWYQSQLNFSYHAYRYAWNVRESVLPSRPGKSSGYVYEKTVTDLLADTPHRL